MISSTLVFFSLPACLTSFESLSLYSVISDKLCFDSSMAESMPLTRTFSESIVLWWELIVSLTLSIDSVIWFWWFKTISRLAWRSRFFITDILQSFLASLSLERCDSRSLLSSSIFVLVCEIFLIIPFDSSVAWSFWVLLLSIWL